MRCTGIREIAQGRFQEALPHLSLLRMNSPKTLIAWAFGLR
jgi:hypothetical protein